MLLAEKERNNKKINVTFFIYDSPFPLKGSYEEEMSLSIEKKPFNN